MKIIKTMRGYNLVLDNGFRLYDLKFEGLVRCLK